MAFFFQVFQESRETQGGTRGQAAKSPIPKLQIQSLPPDAPGSAQVNQRGEAREPVHLTQKNQASPPAYNSA